MHGELKEEVYIDPPPRYAKAKGKVCKLKKSLYGLKQASRQWFAKLTQKLSLQGYSQSRNDYSLFIKKQGHHITILAIYVDDIILTGNNHQKIEETKAF